MGLVARRVEYPGMGIEGLADRLAGLERRFDRQERLDRHAVHFDLRSGGLPIEKVRIMAA